MSTNPNKLSLFWKELKRRNVVRVVTVYAGAAFVIIELINNITEPLRLPDWTPTLVIVLLAIGFPVVIIFSWIYDVHPEEGMVKTKPARKIKEKDITKSSNGWKIASYISFVVIVGLIVLNVVPHLGKREIHDKSIAVLPCKYLSDEPGNEFMADGVMDEILLNLAMIKSLRVLPRTSLEQYRETEKTVTEICQELDVSYLLESSFLKKGDQVRLIVQLITPGKEEHVWAKNYDRNWMDIFTVQSEVARQVAGELQAVITPEEQKRINKALTPNLAAYEIYLKANTRKDEFIKNQDQTLFEAADGLYNATLEMDSAFARAYSGLASLYLTRYIYEKYLDETFLDTVLNLCNKAISIDDQIAEAYYIRGSYLWRDGHHEEVIADFDKALEINPNYSDAYVAKGFLLYRISRDYQQSIENFKKALSLVFGEERLYILEVLTRAYQEIGMADLAKKLMEEKLSMDGDSASWFHRMAWMEFSLGHFEDAYGYAKKGASLEGDEVIGIEYFNCLSPTYKDAYYENVLKLIKLNEQQNQLPLQYAHRIGYAFYQVGKLEEADRYFNLQIEYGEESIRLGNILSQTRSAQYDLATTYAFKGVKEKAYKYLTEFASMENYPLWQVSLLKNDPLFNSIRDEPEFQQIVRDVEAKYQAEHERVRQWLEENDML